MRMRPQKCIQPEVRLVMPVCWNPHQDGIGPDRRTCKQTQRASKIMTSYHFSDGVFWTSPGVEDLPPFLVLTLGGWPGREASGSESGEGS